MGGYLFSFLFEQWFEMIKAGLNKCLSNKISSDSLQLGVSNVVLLNQ